jgi:Ca2+-binding EF-hand superfamily protein
MDSDRDGSISLDEFTDRFKETFDKFQADASPTTTGVSSNSRNANALLRQLAEKMFSETTPTLSNIKSWFRRADTSGTGRLHFEAFVKLLTLVNLASVWSKDQQQRVFKLIDANSSGEINYREWKKAFSFVILESSQSRRVMSFISRYSNELLIGFVTCDVDGVGKLHSVDEFKSIIMPLVELKKMETEISDEDVSEVYQAFADRDGRVDYHKILKSVKITQK